jgi:two-component system nitrate/nitrite response regulator NarL
VAQVRTRSVKVFAREGNAPVRPQRSEFTRENVRLFVIAEVRLHRESVSDNLSRGGFTIAGTASTSEDVITRIAAAQPHVVVVDMATPAMQSIARVLALQAPGVKTVAFAVGDSEDEILACIDAGIAGYVSREAAIGDLVAAIESVLRGELPVPPRIAATLFRRLTVVRQSERESLGPVLTARERQILLLIDEGLSNKEIAARLTIEVATVKNHVHSLLTKMNVTTRGQAAARLSAPSTARRIGATTPHEFIA